MDIEPTVVAGKDFNVEINGIQDRNFNMIDLPIKFTKRFAELDFDGASTTFKFKIENTNCTQEMIATDPDEVKLEIASAIELSSHERVKLFSLICLDDSTIIADVEILPPTLESNTRNLVSTYQDDVKSSLELVQRLQRKIDNAFDMDNGGRLLLHNISPMRKLSIWSIGVNPSQEDQLKFGSTPEELLEEDNLQSFTGEDQSSRNLSMKSHFSILK